LSCRDPILDLLTATLLELRFVTEATSVEPVGLSNDKITIDFLKDSFFLSFVFLAPEIKKKFFKLNFSHYLSLSKLSKLGPLN
jgi:hypothetical protein